MDKRTCVITGATSGIGMATAKSLARRGMHIILLARNPEKAERTKAELVSTSKNENIDIVLGDLSSLKQVRQAAGAINEKVSHIDVLINNAGLIMGNKRVVTNEGFEMTFVVNHLSAFLLTALLYNKLLEAKQPRVLTVSSEAHRFGKLNFKDLQMEKGYSGLKAYGVSKLLNILFTRELAKRTEGTSLTANCIHPGAVASNFGDQVGGFFGSVINLAKPFMINNEQGAATSIYLATSEEGGEVNGEYYSKSKIKKTNDAARSDYNARRLWEISVDLTGEKFLSK